MDKYNQRGVSASKEDVHNAIKNIDKGLYPKAFCKIIPDLLGGDPQYCNIMHADGAGTKSSLAYMYWRETGDLSVWKGIAVDAIVMNTDDLLCVGALDPILLSSQSPVTGVRLTLSAEASPHLLWHFCFSLQVFPPRNLLHISSCLGICFSEHSK